MDAVRIRLAHEKNSILAGALGGQEGVVGFLEEFFARRGVPVVGGQSAPYGQESHTGWAGERELLQAQRRIEPVQHGRYTAAMSRAGDARALRIPKQNGKLVAAVARDDVLLAAVLPKRLAGDATFLLHGAGVSSRSASCSAVPQRVHLTHPSRRQGPTDTL